MRVVADAEARKTAPEGASPVSGVVPPVEHRFKPGGPGGPGRPRGADPRAALLRELARGSENDTEAATDEERLGDGARETGRKMLEAAARGDVKAVKALAEMFNQALGKPQEFVHQTGSTTINLNLGDAKPTEPPT